MSRESFRVTQMKILLCGKYISYDCMVQSKRQAKCWTSRLAVLLKLLLEVIFCNMVLLPKK